MGKMNDNVPYISTNNIYPLIQKFYLKGGTNRAALIN